MCGSDDEDAASDLEEPAVLTTLPPPPHKCVASQGSTQFLPALKKTCIEQDKGVPEAQHVASNKATMLGNGASDFFAANAALMWSTERNNEE